MTYFFYFYLQDTEYDIVTHLSAQQQIYYILIYMLNTFTYFDSIQKCNYDIILLPILTIFFFIKQKNNMFV